MLYTMKLSKIGMACLISVILISNSCSWKDVRSELPDATQEGKGTFGCKVDGRVFVPRSSLTRPRISFSYDPTWNGGTLSIKDKYWFRDNKNINIATTENVSISLGRVSEPGRYSFNNADSSAFGGYSIWTQNEKDSMAIIRHCYYDEIGDTRSGILNITKLNMNKGILAGTFEFTLTRSNPLTNCNSILKITEGRFDLLSH